MKRGIRRQSRLHDQILERAMVSLDRCLQRFDPGRAEPGVLHGRVVHAALARTETSRSHEASRQDHRHGGKTPSGSLAPARRRPFARDLDSHHGRFFATGRSASSGRSRAGRAAQSLGHRPPEAGRSLISFEVGSGWPRQGSRSRRGSARSLRSRWHANSFAYAVWTARAVYAVFAETALAHREDASAEAS